MLVKLTALTHLLIAAFFAQHLNVVEGGLLVQEQKEHGGRCPCRIPSGVDDGGLCEDFCNRMNGAEVDMISKIVGGEEVEPKDAYPVSKPRSSSCLVSLDMA